MPRAYQGSFITKTPITPSGPYQCGAASGVWTIDQMVGWQKAGLWPTAGNAFGTVGIFATGTFSNYQKYTFASCTISSGASICSPPSFYYGIAAAGTVNFGIFQNTISSCRTKYTYSGCVKSAGASASVSNSGGSAAGNSTVGIFALGRGLCCVRVSTRNKYTYSSCSNSSATSASTASTSSSAAGNSTVGIFALGSGSCCVKLSTRDKYTYSGDVNASAASASAASFAGSAAGNSTAGIFAIGYSGVGGSTSRNKYIYASCINCSATSATNASYFGGAAGNSTVGIFALGNVAGCGKKTNKYTYSNDTSVAATSFSSNIFSGTPATSNGTTGVNA